MVPFFTATLLLSCFALAALIGVKRWELTTGRVIGAGVRLRAHTFFFMLSLWVERILPTLVRMYAKLAWRASLRYLHVVVALVVLHTERLLEKVLHTLRHTTDVRRGMGEASAFLREVSEHKRKLLRGQRPPVSLHKK